MVWHSFWFPTRLALLPMIFTMIVAFSLCSVDLSVQVNYLSSILSSSFFHGFAGACKFSVDGIIRSKISRDNFIIHSSKLFERSSHQYVIIMNTNVNYWFIATGNVLSQSTTNYVQLHNSFITRTL